MSVTPSPDGAGSRVESTVLSLVCLLSLPDAGSIPVHNSITGRHVLRASENILNPLSLPLGSSAAFSGNSTNITTQTASHHVSEGVFYCEASNNG